MQPSHASRAFAKFTNAAAHAAGRAVTFSLAVAVVVIWAVSGPLFGFSDTWQLVINTGTTVVTFLMVFLIQSSQNRDGAAIQVKLDEIISKSHVRNSFIGIEHLTEEELEELRAKCEARAITAGSDALRDRHSSRNVAQPTTPAGKRRSA